MSVGERPGVAHEATSAPQPIETPLLAHPRLPSRKMNIFMYGADEKRRGVCCPSARVFPKLLSWNRIGRKYVSFKDCSFAVKKGRESTARVVVVR